ncbi:MAG: carboxypeptidase regulatory-like domain-containing protein [Candidatus Solibacter usitatus]|nr:carboxypeptidase regulatory-like domain-containing protein [Candidatus Solibacter usitatus]
MPAPAIGLTRETTSNDNGYFTVVTLPVGNYDVKVEAAGWLNRYSRTRPRPDSQTGSLAPIDNRPSLACG